MHFIFKLDMKFESDELTSTLEVVCLGLFRTGTNSLKKALEILGYKKCHHFFEFCDHPEQEEYINNLCRKETTDLNCLYRDYDCAADVPTALFPEEIFSQYPNALYVANTREIDSWYASCLETVFFEPKASKPHIECLNDFIWKDYFNDKFGEKEHAIKRFNEHYEHIRKIIPKNQLLDNYTVKDGWESLCHFLKKEIPTCPFPITNSVAEFNNFYKLS